MTRIASVSVHSSNGGTPAGLKRQLFTLALSGCDLLVGANGAGKTTRGPLAITAALEGLASVPTDPGARTSANSPRPRLSPSRSTTARP